MTAGTWSVTVAVVRSAPSAADTFGLSQSARRGLSRRRAVVPLRGRPGSCSCRRTGLVDPVADQAELDGRHADEEKDGEETGELQHGYAPVVAPETFHEAPQEAGRAACRETLHSSSPSSAAPASASTVQFTSKPGKNRGTWAVTVAFMTGPSGAQPIAVSSQAPGRFSLPAS